MTLARPSFPARRHMSRHIRVYSVVFLARDPLPVLTFADRPLRAQQFRELVPLALANVIDDRRLSLSSLLPIADTRDELNRKVPSVMLAAVSTPRS